MSEVPYSYPKTVGAGNAKVRAGNPNAKASIEEEKKKNKRRIRKT